MKRFDSKKVSKRMGKTLLALPSMGIAFVVLGVIILAASFTFSLKNNAILLAGLFFIVAGCIGYVYSLKK